MKKSAGNSVMIPRFEFTFSIRDFYNALFSPNKGFTNESRVEVEKYFNSANLLFTDKARIGLKLILTNLGLKQNAKIGVQPFTCSSVLNAITRSGFSPVFIDIDRNLQMSIEDLARKKNQIDALIVTHTFGFPDKVREIKSFVNDKPIIEDCSQALFSGTENKSLGSDGIAAIFSLGYGKLFGVGSGGIIVSNDDDLFNRLKKSALELKAPPFSKEIKSLSKNLLLGFLHNKHIYHNFTYIIKSRGKKNTVHLEKYPDIEYLMPGSYFSLFFSRFNQLTGFSKQQKSNGERLNSMVDHRFRPISFPSGSSPNFFLIPLQSPGRDKIVNYLQENKIEAGKHFSNSASWVQLFNYSQGSCPDFEMITKELFTLPCHYNLNDSQIEYIAGTLNNYK